jgi:hypothetical protein
MTATPLAAIPWLRSADNAESGRSNRKVTETETENRNKKQKEKKKKKRKKKFIGGKFKFFFRAFATSVQA